MLEMQMLAELFQF